MYPTSIIKYLNFEYVEEMQDKQWRSDLWELSLQHFLTMENFFLLLENSGDVPVQSILFLLMQRICLGVAILMLENWGQILICILHHKFQWLHGTYILEVSSSAMVAWCLYLRNLLGFLSVSLSRFSGLSVIWYFSLILQVKLSWY